MRWEIPRARTRRARMGAAAGFTLIEILVVISIIGLLTALLLPSLISTSVQARIAVAKAEVSGLSLGLEAYGRDEGDYPGAEEPAGPGSNLFPRLHGALLGARRPAGPGGRAAPYARVQEAKIAVYCDGSGELRKATRAEIRDDGVEKYLLDPWGSPYVYRPNKGRRPAPHMRNLETADIYSPGPDEVDDTSEGADDDDIGNW
ncbi:MAG: prepilin-type N-terminal cleavage/methylation domain-containing protein [Planctomycetes bacterium]|nr:prepilin-type N-terminal cleavage/methylation domain-containing protein [Planctomycetota bacterium]